MNDELNELLRKLENATAPAAALAATDATSIDDACSIDTGMVDAETVLLRDTWLAFGRLLETADATGPTSLPSIALPSIALPRPPQATALSSVRKSSRWRWLPAALLVVTASLAAVVCVLGFRSSRPQQNAPSTPDVAAGTKATTPFGPQISNLKSSSMSPPKPELAIKPEIAMAKKPAASAPSAEWDDADDKQIDEQISAIQTDISLTQRKWDEQIESSQAIEYRINEDEQEISKDPL